MERREEVRHAWVAERDGRRTLGREKRGDDRAKGCILHLTFMSLRLGQYFKEEKNAF